MSREKTPTKEKTRRNTKIHEKNRDEKSGVAAFFVIVSRFISFLCEKLILIEESASATLLPYAVSADETLLELDEQADPLET